MNGISPIIGAIFFLIIAVGMLTVMTYLVNQQGITGVKSAQYLQSINQEPIVFESWHNGVVELATTMPFVITHIILPNGTILNTSIFVQNVIPLGDILVDGAKWAIIVTDRGTWYNVTYLTFPYLKIISPDGLYYGIPWNTSVLQDVGINPNWYALEGVQMLNFTASKINATAGYLQKLGVTNVTAVTYVGNATGWVNITFYAPMHYAGTVKNPYFWNYYVPLTPFQQLSPVYSPYNNYYYYLLVTTNPYAYKIPAIWYSAIYANATYNETVNSTVKCILWKETSYTNPQGGILFRYSYINSTIGVYVPVFNETSGNIYYFYIPFNIFEITNASAFVPNKVEGNIWVKVISSNLKIKSGTFHERYVNYTGQWVPIDYSWVVAPLQYAPYLGTNEFTKPYGPPGGGEGVILPDYVDFPMTDYTGFPSYFGYNYSWLYMHVYATNDTYKEKIITVTSKYPIDGVYRSYTVVIPDYTVPVFPTLHLKPTTDVYAVDGNPKFLIYNSLYPYQRTQIIGGQVNPAFWLSVSLLDQDNDPVNVYKLSINLYTGQILLYGFESMTGNWVLLSEMAMSLNYPPSGLSGLEFVNYLPVYAVAPYGTYLLGTSATGHNATNA